MNTFDRIPGGFLKTIALLAGICTTVLAGEIADSPVIRDLEIIKQRVLEPLLEPVDGQRIRQLVDSIRPDGSWPDVDYEHGGRSGWKTSLHLSKLLQLSRAYRSPGSGLRGDARLRKAVFAGLDYWLTHDFQNSNWWWNQIGVPRTLNRILLLLDEELSNAQRRQGVEILKRAKLGMTGQNLVWVAEITAVRGVLERDSQLVAEAFGRIADEIRVIPNHEGIQADFSFHQHGPCLYSHGYGAGFAADCSRLATQVTGTRFAFPPQKIETLSRLILDGHQWMTRGGTVDYGAIGREITRKHENARYLSKVAEDMLELPTGREAEFRALADRVRGDFTVGLMGNRHFWRSDMMTHHRQGYTTSARMFSQRIVNTDMPCNSEGLKSHHIADGCNLLLRTGNEYRDVFPVWDWRKIPGTTVEQTPTLSGPVRRQGSRTFVGGVSDGTYGLAAFDFARDRLTARKAWFFFDAEYVCLGAGITCTSDHSVCTTVNQCHLQGEVTIYKRQEKWESSPQKLIHGEHMWDNPAWVHHDGVAYLFPQPVRIFVRNNPQRGSWWAINQMYSKQEVARDVFALWIVHGKHPQGASYAYIVAPGMPLESVAGYAARPDVVIARNDAEIQAVWHEKLKMAGIAFYRAGSVKVSKPLTVGVDKPCLLLLRESSDRLAISVSNPENKKLTVAVRISRKVEGDRVRALGDDSTLQMSFELPGGRDAGKSVTQTVRVVR